jgi:hypothetical protein
MHANPDAAKYCVFTAPLLWCAGTELTAQGGGCGHGGTRATGYGAGRASHTRQWRAWCRPTGQRKRRSACTPARAAQALPSALPVGSADRPHLRGVPAFMPTMWWPDANSIAFITHSAQIRQILDHIGVNSEPPRLSPARGPPLWEDGDAQTGEGIQIDPDWDLAGQPAPDYEVDQRINW